MINWLKEEHTNNKYNSRRYKLMLLLTLLVTFLFLLPPLLAFIFNTANPELTPITFNILTEASYVTLMFGIWGGYLSSDFLTKRLSTGSLSPATSDQDPLDTQDTQQEESNA